MCGWTQSISSYSDDLNTEFDALQVTWSQTLYRGVAVTANYQWASAFDEQSGFATWDRAAVHARDSNVRTNQLVGYGSWDLPFGRGKNVRKQHQPRN